MKQLLSIEGTLRKGDSKSHLCFPFEVPPGAAGLAFRFSYEPKEIGEASSRELFLASLPGYIEDPEERRLVASDWKSYMPAYNMITFSLDDPEGRFRGNVHRGSPLQRYRIGERDCGYGLVPGPIAPGEWRVVLNVFAVHGEGCRYALSASMEEADD